eukprot:Seg2847.7 transcript_id=Seg2847.7/GoldUCD/mRNA.D3Y31 product="Palmitoyltransferase ZDHHC17" protein_id=Seg2847.7/GoldUCD/D3Y31
MSSFRVKSREDQTGVVSLFFQVAVMADEVDPGCGPVIGGNHRECCDQKPYPTNTYSAPSHVPGKKGSVPFLGGAPAYTHMDYSGFDIVKAAQYGIVEKCQQLIEEEGIDVRVPDAENVTILHWASINNRVQVMEYLISKGAVVDQRGGNLNGTPLHWAIRQGHLDAVVTLMKHGADPGLQDSEGCTGLHLAAQFGHTAIVAFLLAKGMDVDLMDKSGMTPLMWAAYRSFGVDTMRVLLNFGASINLADKMHKNTALHWAVASSNTNAIRPLLKSGANLSAVNEQNLTPLDLATERRNNWMIHQIQFNTTKRGMERSSFMYSFFNKRENKKKMGMLVPIVAMFMSGFILEYSTWWLYTVIMMGLLALTLNYVLRFFREMEDNTIALGTYLATKFYMFSTLFFYFRPLIGPKILFFFTINTTGLCYFFYKSWMSDPGIIKSTPSEQKKNIIELAERGMLKDFGRFCATCLVRRPVRSKHCSICNKCVARMDHHCPWIDNCVGYQNHHHFFWYIFFLFWMNIWYQWGAVRYFNTYCGPFNKGILASIVSVWECAPWVTWGYCHALFHSLWVGALVVCNCYQLFWLGMTTNERMNSTRYRHFNDSRTGKIQSPFARGVIQNMADFFEFSFFGLVRPNKTDWMNELDVTKYTKDAQAGQKSFDNIV